MLIEQKVAAHFQKSRKTLSVAESCTGGLLGHRITNIPGSSLFLKLGVISYSNEAKAKILGIPSMWFKKYGAVSGPVARRMAQNIRKLGTCDYGIGITGIAGPAGGTEKKPIGLVFIAAADKNKTIVRKFLFKGTRLQVKQQATTQALQLLLALKDT